MSSMHDLIIRRVAELVSKGTLVDVDQLAQALLREFPDYSRESLSEQILAAVTAARGNASLSRRTRSREN